MVHWLYGKHPESSLKLFMKQYGHMVVNPLGLRKLHAQNGTVWVWINPYEEDVNNNNEVVEFAVDEATAKHEYQEQSNDI